METPATSEPGVADLLSVDQAIARLDATPVVPRAVERRLGECLGLVLAEDLGADRDYPPFDKALMDGYAVRAGDVGSVPVSLKLVGEVAAGGKASGVLQAGEAMAIMTGAPMPEGADGVVPVEDVEAVIRFDPKGPGREIRVMRAARPGRYIARRGSDVERGAVVLAKGTKLESAQLAAAATVGAGMVKVYAAPRVGVLSTGDEIVPFDAEMVGASQIRNSNNLMLIALLSRLGCRAVDLGHSPDDPAQLRRGLEKGMALDALFVTGGMSMGRYDYVPKLLREMGADLKITKLRIKPGKPFVFGTVPRGSSGGPEGGVCYVFGLPGNPVSSFACTIRLASRVLARMGGTEPRERWVRGRLAEGLPANGPREFYQPVVIEEGTDREAVVRVLPYKGSADLFTLARANGLMVRGENEGALLAGAGVRVMGIGT